jgi:hypothetical protein
MLTGDTFDLTARIITLLSDFGLKDPYVAEMKAVISTISPEAKIIDISHDVYKFNIRMGAFVLASATGYFPKGTVHVAVVDPGVGTKRRGIVIVTAHAVYIGPDNGVLMLAATRERIRHVYAITNSRLMLPQVSSTFHGRDVFAPVAAHVANGTPPSKVGPEITDYTIPKFASPSLKSGKLTGEILHIDDFGNIITNIASADLDRMGVKNESRLKITMRDNAIEVKFRKTYGDAPRGTILTLIGSHDFLEVAINQDNAAKRQKIEVGDIVAVEKA